MFPPLQFRSTGGWTCSWSPSPSTQCSRPYSSGVLAAGPAPGRHHHRHNVPAPTVQEYWRLDLLLVAISIDTMFPPLQFSTGGWTCSWSPSASTQCSRSYSSVLAAGPAPGRHHHRHNVPAPTVQEYWRLDLLLVAITIDTMFPPLQFRSTGGWTCSWSPSASTPCSRPYSSVLAAGPAPGRHHHRHNVPAPTVQEYWRLDLLLVAITIDTMFPPLQFRSTGGWTCSWSPSPSTQCSRPYSSGVLAAGPAPGRHQHRHNVPAPTVQEYWRLDLLLPFVGHLRSELEGKLRIAHPQLNTTHWRQKT